MTVLTTALVGIVFGIALTAPPGPMNDVIAEESVTRGWKAGFQAGLGVVLADALFFVLVLAGVVAVFDRYPVIRPALFFVGGALMCYFAGNAIREAQDVTAFTDNGRTTSESVRKTFALSLTNPYQIGFWLTVGVGLLQSGTIDIFAYVPGARAVLEGALVVQTGSPALLVGLFAGIAIWMVGYPVALVSAGRRVDAVTPAVATLSAVVLAGFGFLFLTIGAVHLF